MDSLFELRMKWVGARQVLQYRERKILIDAWDEIRKVGDWSEWKDVPNV